MAEALTIEDGRVGLFHYILRDDDENVLDLSHGRGAMAFLAGAGNIVSGLEKELSGHKAGDQFTAVIAPEDAYGVESGQPPERVRRKELPKDQEVGVGRPVYIQEGGKSFALWVTKVQGAWVWVTGDHPLAGKTLHFEVEVVGCREATSGEKQHGHAHGADGTAKH
jgi:FKBP-type peptidyl-prolyl cis-trans isomerase SlyD